MQVHQRVAFQNHVLEQRMGDSARVGSLGFSRKKAVQVPPPANVSVKADKTLEIDNGQADYGPAQILGLQLVQHTPGDLDAIDLVAVDRGRKTEHGPRPFPVYHAQRCRRDEAAEGLGRAPGQLAVLPWWNGNSQDLEVDGCLSLQLGFQIQLRICHLRRGCALHVALVGPDTRRLSRMHRERHGNQGHE